MNLYTKPTIWTATGANEPQELLVSIHWIWFRLYSKKKENDNRLFRILKKKCQPVKYIHCICILELHTYVHILCELQGLTHVLIKIEKCHFFWLLPSIYHYIKQFTLSIALFSRKTFSVISSSKTDRKNCLCITIGTQLVPLPQS